MVEEIEIKRKVFSVIEDLGEHSKKVERKGEYYFLKDFSHDSKSFFDYVDGYNKLKVTGIRVPKLYMYDKDRRIVVTEFIEGNTVFDDLMIADLSDEYFDSIFAINFFAKKEKVSIDFYPSNFKYVNGKLYYLSMLTSNYDASKSFEKKDIWFWVYSKEFVRSALQRHVQVDQKRNVPIDAAVNKDVTLKVIKFYR